MMFYGPRWTIVGVVGSWLPARRAASVDPLIAIGG
jgi:ABC-type antimicrobial peptide transport system permease subunit